MKRYKTNNGLTKRCGCARRSWDVCSHPWFFTFQFKGRVERGSLGVSDRQEAIKRFTAIKAAMMNGTYAPPRRVVPAPAVDQQPSFETVAGYYLKQHVDAKLAPGAASAHKSIVTFLSTVQLPCGLSFAAKPFRLITQEDVEIAIGAKRIRNTTGLRPSGGAIAANRMQGHLGALWNWAIQPKRAHADKSPFSFGGRVPEELKKTKERGRDRRLAPGEEEQLLTHAAPHLRDCIIAALETGMRKGEILSLQWKHVRWMQNEIAIDWRNTKTKQGRDIPISPRLREVFARRHKAHPKDLPWTPEAYVFGNAIGERVADTRAGWDTTVLRAHGVSVVRGQAGRVCAENRGKLRAIDLHFHDLRHEAGSRKLEGGWPLHAVSRWLGHTKLTTTDTYLNATTRLLHELNDRSSLASVG